MLKIKNVVFDCNYSYLLNMQSYSKREINNAGYVVNDNTKDKKERQQALKVIEEFRLQHLYPTTMIRNYITNKSNKYKGKLIMQRLKKMPTILDKISNNRKQFIKDLYDMQDIGGIRIVLKTPDDVLKLANELQQKSKHTIRKIKNYIDNPKLSGYRGIHIVYSVNNKKQPELSKLKVELQIRSKLQHIWATTLEIYDYWYGTSLKTQRGEQEWFEFFELCASLFANLENKLILPQHQEKGIQWVVDRLKEVKDKKIQKLKAIRIATTNSINNTSHRSDDILIIIKKKNKEPQIIKFSKKQYIEAYKKYQELENKFKNSKKVEIVMFAVNDGKKITKSYPNFFNDTRKFIEKIEEYYKQYDKNASIFCKLKQRIKRFFKTHSLISNIHNFIL